MQNPYEKYKQQSVMTMTQGDMVKLLFEEAVKQLERGTGCIKNKDIPGSNDALQRAQKIFNHLLSTLDQQYEIAGSLASLYEFVNYKIIQAKIKKDPQELEDILPMIIELKDTFAQADKQARIQQNG